MSNESINSSPIFPAGKALTSFRDGGYKNTANAIAEIIDNSIDANADNIKIFTLSNYVQYTNTRQLKVNTIGVLDNGDGMNKEILSSCLGFGESAGDKTSKIGKFGVGLTQSSISQCKRIEVYSWQNGEKPNFAYLDIDEVQETGQQNLNPAESSQIPEEILNHYGRAIKDSGTLVLWKNCDRIDISKSDALYRRMNKHLCRVFRHFLDDDDNLGNKRIIQFDSIDEGVISTSKPLLANDPLYLLTPNNCPGYENEATNEAMNELDQDGYFIDVEYEPGLTSRVHFLTSIAKPEIQSAGDQMSAGSKTAGSTPYGKHYGDNVGISFVRSGREIILSPKGYFDAKVTTQRWWGCEVRFDPVLDEFFGVTNNKQDLTDIEWLAAGDMTDVADDAREGDLKAIFRAEFQRELVRIIGDLKKAVDKRSSGVRASKPRVKPIVEVIQNDIDPNEATHSADVAKLKDKDTLIQEKIDLILAEGNGTSEEEAEEIAKEQQDWVIDITLDSWAGATFIDVKVIGKAATLVINIDHDFYKEFYKPIEEMNDKRPIKALQAVLLAYTRSEDLSRNANPKELFDELRDDWGRYITKMIRHAKN